jgi:hypothetical protein
LPSWEARFSVGVLSMVCFMLPCMLEAGLFFCTTLYVTVLYWSDRTSMNLQSPSAQHNSRLPFWHKAVNTLAILKHVSGSLNCASIAFIEKAVMNAAGCARLHDTQDGMRVHVFLLSPLLPFLAI